jgi:outer membrane protein OmpA-like peptidoglycan-associated protein/Tol biopolymer transport system component
MTIGRYIGFLFFMACFHLVSGQNDKLIKKADQYFTGKDFLQAIKYYQQALEQHPEDPYINMRVAQSYMLSSAKNKALPFASAAVKNSEKPSAEMFYTLGEANQFNHNYDSAAYYYKKSDAGNINKKVVSKKLIECTFGKKYIANPQDVKITNAGDHINTVNQEYLPYITADMMELFFTSRRPGSTGGKKDVDGRYFEDIYMSKNKGGAWEQAVNIGPPLNTDIHDACIGLSPDGQTMFVYKGSNGGDIYTSRLKGNEWGKPEPLSVNTEFFESTACLSPDERTLFFVRKVMHGSRDIYVCNKTIGGNWSKPRKLEVINTEFDEDCPFMHPDGKTLYFSSKGHSSMGGYDIFKTTRTSSGSWTTPENLGYPINTASDEIYFVLGADGKIGFYSSDKEGGLGQQDIYSIRMPVCAAPKLALLKGRVQDEITGKPLAACLIITDNQSKEVIAKLYSNEQTGEYLVPLPSGKNYGIAIESKGCLFHSENICFSDKDDYVEINKDIPLVRAEKGSKVVLRNIFFDSGKTDLKPESASELMRLAALLKQNAALKIEISGHTDNQGDAAANRKLSELRAEKVTDFLISSGIPKTRLSTKGYGSSMPLEPNNTAEGRQHNRRTEFKVL